MPTFTPTKVATDTAPNRPKKWKIVKGYKGFNFTINKKTGKMTLDCRGTKFEVGKTYELPGTPTLCNYGFHFCKDLEDVNQHYSFRNEEHIFAEVEALGECDASPDKMCTTKIKIVRLLNFKELTIKLGGSSLYKAKLEEFIITDTNVSNEYNIECIETGAKLCTEEGPYTFKPKTKAEKDMFEEAVNSSNDNSDLATFVLEKGSINTKIYDSQRYGDVVFIKPGSLKFKLKPRMYEKLTFNI